jgi:hypothetical protein
LDENAKRVCIKLTAIDQDAFSLFDKSIIYPVPNKWGKNGWTFIELSLVNSATLLDALTAAYCTVAPNRLIRQIQK